MDFGVALPNFKYGANPSAEHILGVAQAAEQAGYTSIWTTDHILVGPEHPRYGNVYESLVTLTWVAAHTDRIRIGTSVLVLPMRNAVLAAKQLATLDALAPGRLIVAVAVGWNEEEYDFVGAPFHQRGRLLDESIGVLRNLWTEAQPRFQGEFYHYGEALFEPKPSQPGGPPIWIGGNSAAAVRRAGLLGDGWHGDEVMPDDFGRAVERMNRLAKGRGEKELAATVRFSVDLFEATGIARHGDGVEGHYMGGESEIGCRGSFAQIRAFLRRYRDLGATDFVCQFEHETAEQHVELVHAFGREIIATLDA